MKTYIVTQTEIVEANDTAAITRAIKWLRDWTQSEDYTYRYVVDACDGQGEANGLYDVCCDDRGQNPMESKVLATCGDRRDAAKLADKLNDEIDAELRGYILEDKIELPDEVDFVSMGQVRGGKYPQSRNCTVSFRVKHAELGPIDFDINTFWSVNSISDRGARTREICDTVNGEFQAALTQAIDAKREQLAEDAE